MRVIGVELSANDANVCMLSLENELFQIPDCRARKISLPKNATSSDLRYFQSTFVKLIEDYKINKIVVRERPMKGKFAGGAVGFKMEAALELIKEVDTVIMAPTAIKEAIKRNPVPVDFAETGLKGFQQIAFDAAYGYLMKDKYEI